MNIQLIHIQQLDAKHYKKVYTPQSSPEYEYIGIAIEDEGAYYYWARGVSISINRHEYDFIKANPNLYYFSTALKLHFRIEKQIQLGGVHGF